MRFNMKTGLASQKQLSASAVDFPRVNENYTGRYLELACLLVNPFYNPSTNWVKLVLISYW